ncbi:MAG: helix-turn-helix domain-containing protein [Xanthomonadaceae bacterium]|nr:helix-turn-helix domain-containing protein [Xanthomonadaceae bacterium]
MKKFPDRLREARNAAGLTQEQLGFAVDLTKSSISAWENGRETPSFKLLPELRIVLNRSLDELICGVSPGVRTERETYILDKSAQATTPGEKALLTRYRNLSSRRREALLELMKPEN